MRVLLLLLRYNSCLYLLPVLLLTADTPACSRTSLCYCTCLGYVPMHHTGSRYLRKQYVYTVPLTFLGTYKCTSLVLPVLLYMSGVRTHAPYRQGRYLRKQYVYTVPLTFLGTYTCTSLVQATYVAAYVATYVAAYVATYVACT